MWLKYKIYIKLYSLTKARQTDRPNTKQCKYVYYMYINKKNKGKPYLYISYFLNLLFNFAKINDSKNIFILKLISLLYYIYIKITFCRHIQTDRHIHILKNMFVVIVAIISFLLCVYIYIDRYRYRELL